MDIRKKYSFVKMHQCVGKRKLVVKIQWEPWGVGFVNEVGAGAGGLA